MRRLLVIMGLVSAAFAAWGICPPVSASEICKTNAGTCSLAGSDGSNCACKTPAGSLNGQRADDASAAPGQNGSLLAAGSLTDSKKVSLQIYRKNKSNDALQEWVSGLDAQKFNVSEGTPNSALANDPIDAIFFSGDVPKELIRLVALTLLQKGIEIKSIQLYRPDPARGLPPRTNLIQIGASLANRARQTLSPEAIVTAPLPMYGDLVAKP
jgi:hypothetical protein